MLGGADKKCLRRRRAATCFDTCPAIGGFSTRPSSRQNRVPEGATGRVMIDNMMLFDFFGGDAPFRFGCWIFPNSIGKKKV